MINKGAESLPNKDAQAFKQLAKFHDAKNYKKGLKATEKLLELHPEHPESYAMKALFQLGLGDQNKALQTAKISVMKSKMKSTLCWHTYGTIHKQVKNFIEAAKCFQFALKGEPDNANIQRETANLQIQIRDHSSHVASRFAILKGKPNMIQNWAGFTLAHHLRGDYPSLFKALVSLDNLVKTIEVKPIEQAHYYLYRVTAFKDAEKYESMIEELKKNKDKIKDEIIYHQYLYLACLKLNQIPEAQDAMEFLIRKFPENTDYLRKYQALLKLSDRDIFIKVREEFQSKIARIYELCYIEDSEQFKKEFAAFVKPYYQKNLISLFTEIQIIYETTNKQKQIQEVFLSYESSLEQNDAFPDGEESISPTEHLWALYFLAQHYSLHFNTLKKSYAYINKAIHHTNTVPEFYIIKGQLQYKLHNNFQSLKTINEARKTDLADRYMNNLCVKYLMKCEKPQIAEDVLKMFIRDESSAYELQTQWYIIEAGKSFLKQRNYEAGLRHLSYLNKQFIDMQANQYDFHTYCIRKWTLRQYTELIAFNDNIYDDKKYIEAAGIAIKYLQEYVFKLEEDQKRKLQEAEEENKEEKESKKKKKKKKAQENVVEELTPFEANRKKMDYYGKQYAEIIKKNPLEQALVYAKNIASVLYTNKNNRFENKIFGKAFCQAIDIFIHFKKPLLVLRCLNKLYRTNYNFYEIHITNIKALLFFQQFLNQEPNNKNANFEIVKECIEEFFKSILEDKTIAQYNEVMTCKWKLHLQANIDLAYLFESKKKEVEVILSGKPYREEIIKFYLERLFELIGKNGQPSSESLQEIFYLTHQLEFYGRYTSELNAKLNQKLSHRCSYFTQWRAEVEKLSESTWSMWWLSDYDIEREEIDAKNEKKNEGNEVRVEKEGKMKEIKEDKTVESQTKTE